jgi:phosphatidylglycerophosphate synthase
MSNINTNPKPYLLDKYLYNVIEKYFDPLLCKVKPDYISLIRIIPILFIYYSIITSKKILLIVSILVSVILDFYDGAVARSCKKQSKFGAELDVFMDTIHHVVLITFIILAYIPSIEPYIYLVVFAILVIYVISSQFVFNLNSNGKANNFKDLYEVINYNTILLGFIEYGLLLVKL